MIKGIRESSGGFMDASACSKTHLARSDQCERPTCQENRGSSWATSFLDPGHLGRVAQGPCICTSNDGPYELEGSEFTFLR